MTLEDLGYNSFFENSRNQFRLGGFGIARVTAEFKEAYRVKNENGEYLAKITGKQIFKASSREDYPAVGDWVAITELDNDNARTSPKAAMGHAVIHSILPRQTIIKRKYGDKNRVGEKNEMQVIAANIDVAFIVESVGRDYNLNRFERYFAIAKNGGVEPAIILNKIDLLSPPLLPCSVIARPCDGEKLQRARKEELDEKLIQIRNRFPDIDIISTSAVNNKGINDLRKYIQKGKTYCFLGSSGAGKSSLINKLIGEETIKTGDVSSYSERGKHITTGRQMYFVPIFQSLSEGAAAPSEALSGGWVIDNPGMREVGLADASRGIDAFFDEISELAQKCKFADCAHIHEPGCEVINAVKSGRLDEEKYSNYINLKKESEYFEMNDAEKREKSRQFGKLIKKAKKELKDSGHKNL